jgi:hypothetical protein
VPEASAKQRPNGKNPKPSVGWPIRRLGRGYASDYLTDTGILTKDMDNTPDFRLLKKYDPGRAA